MATQIGDEDSSTEKRLIEDVPTHLQPLKKEADLLHIKCNFTNHLYKLRFQFKGTLSKQIIAKLSANFAVTIRNNIGKLEEMRKAWKMW